VKRLDLVGSGSRGDFDSERSGVDMLAGKSMSSKNMPFGIRMCENRSKETGGQCMKHDPKSDAISQRMFGVLLLVCVAALFAPGCSAKTERMPIRIAHVQWGVDMDLPRGFLERARNHGYTHVLAEFWLSVPPFKADWDGRGGIDVDSSELADRLERLFIQADSYGLRFIPLFQTGNMHSAHLYAADSTMASQLRHRAFGAHGMHTRQAPPQSPDYQPMNAVIEGLTRIVASAFAAARPEIGYENLDFVHLGMDEIVLAWGGKVPTPVVAAGLCEPDRQWMKRHAPDRSSAEQIELLIAASIRNKAERVRAIAGEYGIDTRIMLWADMWDPRLSGGLNGHYVTFQDLWDSSLVHDDPAFDVKSNTVPVRLASILERPDMRAVRDALVLCPWYYGHTPSYDAHATLSHFDTTGYDHVFFTTGARYDRRSGTLEHYPVPPQRRHAAVAYARASLKTSRTIGYGAADRKSVV